MPTPQAVVDKMLDMAKVTKTDFVMDLGSGDGRTVITAAKRGARAMGIEYNPDMVELVEAQREGSRRDRSRDVREGRPLRDRPVEGRRHHDVPAAVDQHEAAAEDPRSQARHAHRLEHVHDGRLAGRRNRDGDRRLLEQLVHGAVLDRAAKVGGTWNTPSGALTLTQNFQMITGTLGNQAIQGRLRGNEITFTAGTTNYSGVVDGNTIKFSSPTASPRSRRVRHVQDFRARLCWPRS